MIQYLTNIESRCQGFGLLAQLAASTEKLSFDELEVDFSRCSFFEANMAAPLAAVLAIVADNINDVKITNMPERVETILRKNGFLTKFGFASLEDANQTTLPFRSMKPSEETLFSHYLDENFRGKGIPRMSPGLTRAFKQSIFEIFHNCIVHSRSRLNLNFCGQFYPNKGRLDFTISDAGVGIRTNVREYLKKNISSVDAIRWALIEGHTTRNKHVPGGIGLKLLKSFIAKNRGKIQIVSRYGYYEYDANKETFEKLSADLPGTTVNIEVNTTGTEEYVLSSEISSNNIF